MADKLGGIDVSHLDALAKLEADQRAVRALIEKAAWHRDKVVDVYTRVVRDYEARYKALDDQAEIVRERVREDLAALDALHDQAREGVEQARVELQESEFRHEIGEFTKEEFLKRQQAIERTIAERQEEFESVRRLRQRYLDLLSTQAAAAPPSAGARPPAPAPASRPTPPAVPAVAAAPQAASAPIAPPAATIVPAFGAVPPLPPFPESLTAPPEEASAPVTDATGSFAPPSVADFQVPPVPAPTERSQFGTVAVSAAMLIEDLDGVPGVHHRLGVVTTIGRTADNQVVVPIREVSRRHAEIVMTDGGYSIKDLGSPNGTFVNGERVSERRLDDGDRIAMGGQVFVFKAS